jgi:hypothetical protein
MEVDLDEVSAVRGRRDSDKTALLWTHYIPGITLMCEFRAETWKPVEARRLAPFGAGVTAGRILWIPNEIGAL